MAETAPPDHGTPPLILVVEDHADGRELCVEALRLYGFRTAEAADGLQAVASAVSLAPASIVMDLSLPGIDGWEAARRIKSDARTRGIPIIALTGHAAAGEQTRFAAGGFDGVLAKPLVPEDLLATVTRVLR